MRLITNEELMAVAGGESNPDPVTGVGAIQFDAAGTRGAGQNSWGEPTTPGVSYDVSVQQYIACGMAVSKADASPTWPNVITAAVTCTPVVGELLSPTKLGTEQQKADAATPFKANQY